MATIFFDLDGTLITYGKEFREIFDRAVPGELSDEIYDVYVSEVLANLEEKVENPYLEAFRRITDKFDLEYNSENVADRYIETEVGSTETVDEMVQVLRTLSDEHKIGILTNGDAEVQRMKIERNSLDEVVDEVIISNELGVRKPDPEIFEEAKNRLSSGKYIFVGDTYEEDIKPAQEAGFQTIYINGEKEAERESQSPEKAIDLLNKILDT